MNQTELAKSFGVTRRTVADWDREGLAEVARVSEKPVRYDPVRAWEWRWENKLPEASSMKDAKTRKLEAEAAAKELELDERRGLLVPVAVFEEVYAARLERLRARCIAFKGSLAPRITGIDTPREAKPLLDAVFNELLDTLRPDNAEEDDEDEDAA